MHHRVSFFKTHQLVYLLTCRDQYENLTVGLIRSHGDLIRQSDIIRQKWANRLKRRDETNNETLLASVFLLDRSSSVVRIIDDLK